MSTTHGVGDYLSRLQYLVCSICIVLYGGPKVGFMAWAGEKKGKRRRGGTYESRQTHDFAESVWLAYYKQVGKLRGADEVHCAQGTSTGGCHIREFKRRGKLYLGDERETKVLPAKAQVRGEVGWSEAKCKEANWNQTKSSLFLTPINHYKQATGVSEQKRPFRKNSFFDNTEFLILDTH